MSTPLRRDSFFLDDDEHAERPREVRRITFEHEWAGTQHELARFVVPLGLEQPGDTQVAVFSPLRRRVATAPTELDRLTDVPTVESVVAHAEVVCRTSLPHVRELFASRTDEETLANLPNLERLIVSEGLDRRSLDPAAVPAGVVDLVSRGTTFGGSVAGISGFTGLRRLKLASTENDSAEPLAGLTELRWLSMTAGKGFRHLAGLERLERLSLSVDGSLAGLKPFRRWARLRQLKVDGRALKSLAGAEAFAALEYLFLYNTGVGDLTPLAGLPALREVRLDHPRPEIDLTALGTLPALRRLSIDMLTITSTGSLPSLRFLHGARALEEVELRGVGLPDGELEALREALPDARIAHVMPPDEEPATAVGPIGYRQLPAGGWSIFQDVSDLLGVRSNIEAEAAVRGALRDEDAELLARVELDSEPDALGVTAASEEDIRRAAAVIGALAGER